MSIKRNKRPVKDVKFNMRLDSDLKQRAERAAAEDNRSLASLIEKLLREYLKGSK
jgi:predicted HicB family RNase H-like nuclease